jgi:hypothetical protein
MDIDDGVTLLDSQFNVQGFRYYGKKFPIRIAPPHSKDALEELVGTIRSDNFEFMLCAKGEYCDNDNCYYGHFIPGSTHSKEYNKEMFLLGSRCIRQYSKYRKK